MTKIFEDGWTIDDIEAAITRNHVNELLYVPIWISMDPPDCQWAENICIQLSQHTHFNVRGNAVLGFGHLARTCGSLNRDTVFPIIAQALADKNDYVRGQAHAAAEEIDHKLGWGIFTNSSI